MTGLPQPYLTTWELSEDGLTYTFTIRDDARWSDGTPITSNDVKFTYEAVVSPKVESGQAGSLAGIESINVIDDKTFTIVLKAPSCAFFDDVALGVMPAHKFAADLSDFVTSKFNELPDVSGGPYLVVERTRDEFVRLQANPTYWLGQPKIPNLILRIIGDTEVTIQSILTGEIDYTDQIRQQDEDQVLASENLTLFSFPLNGYAMFIMNLADPASPMNAYDENGNLVKQPPHPIFGDVNVRQAVVRGYDKESLADTQGEQATRIVGSVPSVIEWAYNSDLPLVPYDPDAAAQLLDDSGWVLNESTGVREKDGRPLEFGVTYRAGSSVAETIGLVAQDQLGQIGMKVNLDPLEGAASSDKVLGQRHDVAISQFTNYNNGVWLADPTLLNVVLLHSTSDIVGGGLNLSSYVNPRVDEIIDTARALPGCNPEERAPLYYELQEITQQEAPIDFVYNGVRRIAYNNRIQGTNLGIWSQWYNVEEWSLSG